VGLWLAVVSVFISISGWIVGLSAAIPPLYEGVEFFGRHLVLGLFTRVGCHWQALIVFSLFLFPSFPPYTRYVYISFVCLLLLPLLPTLRGFLFYYGSYAHGNASHLASTFRFRFPYIFERCLYCLFVRCLVLGGVYSIRVWYLSYPKGICYTTDPFPSPSTQPFRSKMCITYPQKSREGAVFSCFIVAFRCFDAELGTVQVQVLVLDTAGRVW